MEVMRHFWSKDEDSSTKDKGQFNILLFGAVMKKTALTLQIILVLSSVIIAATQTVGLTEANPNFMKGHYCNISLQSPQHIMTYDKGNILLNFTAKTHWNIPPSYFYFYSLDGQDIQSSVKIENVQIVGEENITDDTSIPYIETTLRGQAVLSGLSNGPHSIRVFTGQYLRNGTIYALHIDTSATAWFFVNNTGVSPSSVSSSISEPTFTSPQNKTYNSKVLTLNAAAHWFFASIKSMSYSLDGQRSRSLTLVIPQTESFNHMNGTVIGAVTLPELAEGTHSITVYVEGTTYFPETRDSMEQATVYFAIDVTPPIISGLSIENKTYNQLDLPLDFTVNEPTSWIGCSLDGEANVTLTGNTTLTLKEGPRSIVLYANDTAGNMVASETIYFTINQVFPTMPVVAGVMTTTVVGIGLLVYFKKRKH